MDISSLDVMIRRMQSIEMNFSKLENRSDLVSSGKEDFENILKKKSELLRDEYLGINSSADSKYTQREIVELIEEYADKNGLDVDFVKAVVNQESGYNRKATSKCGAMGLMQLMPGTAKALGVEDPYDARQNIEGGTKYLKGLIDRFKGDKRLALAAYNAGPNAVKKYGDVPPYKETQNYVKNILSSYQRMKGDI